MEWRGFVGSPRGGFEEGRGAVLRGNAAYGEGLALLMSGRPGDARTWFAEAADAWRASWADATPTSWGRPIGVMKALHLAGDDERAAAAAEWALSLDCAE